MSPFTLPRSRFPVRVRVRFWCSVFVVLAGAAAATIGFAQGRRVSSGIRQVAPYDSRVVFTRIAYNVGLGGFGMGSNAWNHDYPAADRNVGAILDYITHARVRLDGTNVLTLDDPEIFQNPVLYVWEPGFWTIRPSEAQNLRKYLLKGGFVIFDDFAENRGGWYAFSSQMQRVIPGARWVELDGRHSIFHSFFEIDRPLDLIPPYDQQYRPIYYGLFEGNDPARRLMAIANFNNDISEYWEFAPTGINPVFDTNEAYKLGINYVMYGLTH